MTDQAQKPNTITTEQAARLLMISGERVRQLSKQVWITKVERDRYLLVDVVQGYIRFRNDEDRRAFKSGAEARVRDARAEEISLRVGQRGGQLIEHAEHIAILDELCGFVRTELVGLPARLTRDMTERRKIEQAVHELLTRLAARAEAMAHVGSASGDAVAAVNSHDAGPVGS
jgi:hypothetical protein